MRKCLWLIPLAVTLGACHLDELLNPTPMCPKRIAYDTLGWVVVTRNGVRTDSLPMTGNAREVCTTTRQVAP